MSTMLSYEDQEAITRVFKDNFEKQQELMERRRLNSSLLNPTTKWVHLELPGTLRKNQDIDWDKLPKVMNSDIAYKNIKLFNEGKISEDKATFGHVSQEFQDEMNEFVDAIEHNPSGTITSTQFPAITVTSVNTALNNRAREVMEKYNLFQIVQEIANDQLYVRYPEYNRGPNLVKYGYQEEQPIDTVEPGSFTETNFALGKAGGGYAMTEEATMRRFTFPIEEELATQLVEDFTIRKHEQIAVEINKATTRSGNSWSAYTPGNTHSTYRPDTDLTLLKRDIRAADRRAVPDIVVSNEIKRNDFYTNDWISGLNTQRASGNEPLNGVFNNPSGIDWATKWVVNEDIEDGKLLALKYGALILLQGVTKVQEYTEPNPERTVFLRKEWFKVHTRYSNWIKWLINI